MVKQKWVDDKPIINILIRTSGRPNYFKNCIQSIYDQTYRNWNIIVGVDDLNSKKYVQPEKCTLVEYDYTQYNFLVKPVGDEYGKEFIFNLYINDLYNYVKPGYILILDDDDVLYGPNSLKKMTSGIYDNQTLVFWRVKFTNRLVPSDNNFGGPPVLRDIDSCGFLFPSSYKIKWEPYKRGDYRVSRDLYKLVPNKLYINEILTKIQRSDGGGNGRRDDLVVDMASKTITLKKDGELSEKNIRTDRKKVVKNNIVINNLTGKTDRPKKTSVEVDNKSDVAKYREIKQDEIKNKNSIKNTSKKFQKILPNRRLNLPIINLGKKSK